MDSGAEPYKVRPGAPGDPGGDETTPTDRADPFRPVVPPFDAADRPDAPPAGTADRPDAPLAGDADPLGAPDAGAAGWPATPPAGSANWPATPPAGTADWAAETGWADESAAPAAGPVPERVEWRVRPAAAVLKGVGAAAFVVAGLWAGGTDRVGLAIGLAGAMVLAVLALRDLVLAVSLAADRDGVTIRGILGHHRVPWSDVERIRVDRRSRRGIRSELVEIDCDTELHLFSRTQLGGADCVDVVRQLGAMRPTA
ncbi:PH domain-containing protein [Actinocatenispora sera]|uniref:PH domain-containing protein n=1 Tax=Actinocatenispora sera TaxID=390989 RepID=UPI003400E36C